MKRLLAFLLFLPLLATASVDITNIPLGGFAMTDTLLGVTNANWAARGTVQDIAGTATNGWSWTNLTVAHAGAVTNGYSWTNLTVAHAGAVTNGYPWTNVPVAAASTVPIAGVVTPGDIITNRYYTTVILSNLVVAQSNNNAGLYVTNGAKFVVITNGSICLSPNNGEGLLLRESDNGNLAADLTANASEGIFDLYYGGTLKTKFRADPSAGSYFLNMVGLGSVGPLAQVHITNFLVKGDILRVDAGGITNALVVSSAGNVVSAGTMTATNGVTVQMLYTNGYTVCTTNKQFYMVNSSTNPIFVLPNAANVPGVIYHFSTTNYGANFIITNATGAQTIRNGSDLSYTNTDNGIKVVSLISDGAHWWLASKGKTTLPNASWSCSTNTTFANVTNTITLDTQENNNGQGIFLDNSAWFTAGVGSRIWVTNAGQYMITFSAVWSKVGGGAANGDIWLRQNSVDVPRTMTLQTIQNATSTNVMTVNFIMPVTGVTYFDLQGASPDGTAQLQSMPAITSPFNRPACPSIIVTVNKVSD